jgi:hypothetical protein
MLPFMRPPHFSEDPDLPPWHGTSDWNAPHPLTSATDLLLAWLPEGTGRGADWDRYFASAPGPAGTPATSPSRVAEEKWDPELANAAVDCLFRFLRALESRDANEALACISPDYHTFDANGEQDRESLRRKVEYAFDLWRHDQVQLSLGEVPDPVFYNGVILIRSVLQIDSQNAAGEHRTQLLRRVAVFEETPGDGWLISALSDTNAA